MKMNTMPAKKKLMIDCSSSTANCLRSAGLATTALSANSSNTPGVEQHASGQHFAYDSLSRDTLGLYAPCINYDVSKYAENSSFHLDQLSLIHLQLLA